MSIHVTADTFEREVLESDLPVLVDFWAQRCGPCRALGAILDQMAETADGYKIVKVNVDEQEVLTTRYGIMKIPTVLLFVNGQIVEQHIGSATAEHLLSLIHRHTR